MPEHLRTLLLDEGDRLDVPAAPTAETLTEGRRLVSRRRWTAGLAAAAVLLVAAAGTGGAVAIHRSTERTVAPATPPHSVERLAYATGDDVYLADGSIHAKMPEVAQTLYYTSVGVLVRTNKTGASDGGAPFHFELVADDGTTTKLGVTLGEVIPSTDPTEPYLAWAEMQGGNIQVVVHDVSTDQDVARVDVPGTFTWGGWAAPPVALSGDTVYVATDGMTRAVDWRTGESGTSDVIPASVPGVQGGRTVLATSATSADVTNAITGESLLTIPVSKFGQVQLSPDGRFVSVASQDPNTTSFDVYDVATGSHVSFDGQPFDWGWTSDGLLFKVKGATLTTCDAATSQCATSSVPPVGAGLVRLGGQVFES
jgi:hypothetical protein